MPGIINSVEYTTPFINAAQYNAYLGGTKVFRVPTPDLVIEDERDTVLEINSGSDGEFIVPFSSMNGQNVTIDVTMNIYVKGQYPAGLQTLQFNGTGSLSRGLTISGLTANTDYIIDIYPTDGLYSSSWNICFGFNSVNTSASTNPNKAANKLKLRKVLLFTMDSVYNASSWGYMTFYGCTRLTEVHDSYESTVTTDNTSTSNGGFMQQMFSGCTALEELEFPTVHVANPYRNSMFYQTFYNCQALTEPIDIVYDNATSAQTIRDTFMYGMYQGCSSLTRCDPEPSYTKVTTIGSYFMAYKFTFCTSLTEPTEEMQFDQTWTTTSIGEYYRAAQYSGCTGLTKTAAESAPKITSATTLYPGYRNEQYVDCSNLEYLGGQLADLAYFSNRNYSTYRAGQFLGCPKLNMTQEDGTITALGLLSYNLLTLASGSLPTVNTSTLANLFDTETGFTGDDGGVELQLYNGSSYVNISSITRGSSNTCGRYMYRGRPASSSIDTYYTTGS